MIRAAVLILALVASSPAHALPCWLVKASYAPYASQGIESAKKWMREHGYSEQTIKEAAACLKHH